MIIYTSHMPFSIFRKSNTTPTKDPCYDQSKVFPGHMAQVQTLCDLIIARRSPFEGGILFLFYFIGYM